MKFNEQQFKLEILKKEFCELLRSTQRKGVDLVQSADTLASNIIERKEENPA